MNAVVPSPANPAPSPLVVDLVADLTDPWSFLGKRRLDQALGALAGTGHPEVRWHGFRMVPEASQRRVPWREQLQKRLPAGVTPEFAERTLTDAGREFGIRFDFTKLDQMPDTVEAHRLVKLAERDGLAMQTAEAIFTAFFEQGRDIACLGELRQIGESAGLSAPVLAAFANPLAARDAVDAEEQRLRSFGVQAVPNLLLNGRILVPGPADVPTYVAAIDQALFPQAAPDADTPTLH
ncbi:MAG: DsbA family protein [Steroidobacteraceae bacterium]